METIVIAGGSGLVGSHLVAKWKKDGHTVRILTRGASSPENGNFHWDPEKGELDNAVLEGITILVNLSGAGIADKRWTDKRKRELFESRTGTTEFLWKSAQDSPTLKQYISASGVNSYGFKEAGKGHIETDPFGTDLVARITKEWEMAADLFSPKFLVTKLRIGMVFAREGGALPKLSAPVRWGFGAAFGRGTQGIPWIHIADLTNVFDHVMTHQLDGVYNANAGNTDNATLTKTIAKTLRKPLWLPKVPSGVLAALLGELSVLLLLGVHADNTKIRSTGFTFRFSALPEALGDLLIKKAEK